MIRPAAVVDKYQTVAFDRNRYSVPRPFAFQAVTVKGYVDRVAIVAGGQVVATHKRSLVPGPPILDPLHYLPTLGRKPGALDHAPVYRDWKLPACFTAFRTELEEHYGATAGTRRFVQVLQLLVDHPLDRVCRAVEDCRRRATDQCRRGDPAERTLAACESQTHRPVVLDHGADRHAAGQRAAP